MKARLTILLLLLISIFIELLFVSFPLIFLFSFIFFAIERRFRYLIPASIMIIAGDAVLLNPPAATLLAVTTTLVFINLYAKYLGSKDVLVYILVGVISVLVYAIIFGYSLSELLKWFILFVIIWSLYRLIFVKHN